MGNSTAFLACRKCDSTQFDEHRICSFCGPVNGLYKGNPLSDNARVEIICEKCHAQIDADPVIKLPNVCQYCRSADLWWKELNADRWIKDHSEQNSDESEVWISGDFDGNYSGSLENNEGGLLDQSQQFSILIEDGYLYNPKRVKEPPKRQADEVRPLYQNVVKSVSIFDGLAESASPKLLFVGILDNFSLHNWSNLSERINKNGVDALVGRISGTAYAKLRAPVESNEASNHGQNLPAANNSEKHEPTLISHAAHKFFISASSKIDETIKKISQTISRKAQDPKQEVQSTQNSNSSPELSLEPKSVCKKCNWFLTILVFALIWFTCSLKQAALAVMPLIAICYLVNTLVESLAPSLRWSDRVTNWLGGLLVASALVILGFMAIPEALNHQCLANYPWWLWVIALILVFTSILTRCWPWLLMVVIWIFALLINYSGPCFSHVPLGQDTQNHQKYSNNQNFSGSQDLKKSSNIPQEDASKSQEVTPIKNQSILENLQRVTDRVVKNIDDNIKNVTSSDEDGNLVANESKTKRADLDMAVNNPNKYFSCPTGNHKVDTYDIYIGGAALFPFNDDQLSPDAKIYLEKLKQLMALRPEAKIILTGNSDIAGTEDIKFQKSLGRANALANWLVENNVTTMDKIQVKGASDLNMYVKNPRPEMQALNRRVDLRIDCPATH